MKDLEKIITKELLRRVLPKETENLSEDFSFYIDEDYIVFRDEGETLFDYNIYKFAFKCKEWALKKGYYLRAEQGINYYDNLQFVCFLNKNMDDGANYIEYWNNTEIEAVVKACEWIQENIK